MRYDPIEGPTLSTLTPEENAVLRAEHDQVTNGQVGGSHYQNLPIQPRQFAMQNRWDSDSFSIVKYLTRYPDKAGVEDVKKGRHFAILRKEWAPRPIPFQAGDIAMLSYVHQNELSPMVGNALLMLDQWVRRGAIDTMEKCFAERTIQRIDIILDWLESNS